MEIKTREKGIVYHCVDVEFWGLVDKGRPDPL
jgi:hypothetical protein